MTETNEAKGVSDKRIAEIIDHSTRKWTRWAKRFSGYVVNDEDDYRQIAACTCLTYMPSIKACETEEHVGAYVKTAVKGAFIKSAGIRAGKVVGVRARCFSSLMDKDESKTPFEESVPCASEDEGERIDAKERWARVIKYAKEYAEGKSYNTREITRGIMNGEDLRDIAARLGCSRENARQAAERFVEYAKQRERERISARRDRKTGAEASAVGRGAGGAPSPPRGGA